MPKYYLAYGSNLNIRQMAYRCPTAKPVGTAVIKGYQLLFKGSKTGAYLTIEKAENSSVPVAVWEVTDDDEKRLDIYEGCPTFYYKTEMEVTVNRRKINAFVYIMHEDRPIGIPSSQYVRTCSVGYSDFGFSLKYLENALNISERRYNNEND
ncbi:MAG: gamma-glutamylcyclotransferase [Ruminococcus flavefaciens]|nr:gamma-glutamylcyclotransferase [Ruminococcus flavefaciens]